MFVRLLNLSLQFSTSFLLFHLRGIFLLESLERESGHLEPEPAEHGSLLALFRLLRDRLELISGTDLSVSVAHFNVILEVPQK